MLDADLSHSDISCWSPRLAGRYTVTVSSWPVAVGEHLQRYMHDRRNLMRDVVDGCGRGMSYLTVVTIWRLVVMIFVDHR